MKLLAVSFPHHDCSISYFDGSTVRYLKFERTKQDKRFFFKNKWEWIREIKNLWNVDINEIDEIVLDFHPEDYYGLNGIPRELQDVIDGKVNTVKLHEKINPFHNYFSSDNVWFIGHHYAHSLSTWMLSDKDPDVSIVIDGIGDFRVWSVFRAGKLINRGKPEHGSFGGEIMKAGVWLGIEASNGNDISGKAMGIQSYGRLDESYLEFLQRFNYKEIRDVFSTDHWFKYKTNELLGKLTPLDWIRTVHERSGQLLINLFSDHADKDELISYSGGVAQNVVWNTELRRHFKNLIIPPHSGDEGLSLGGIEWLRRKNNLPRFKFDNFPYVQSDHPPTTEPTDKIIKLAATMLSQGKIIAWYQGNGEVGPRALGNRSILMDPRIKNGKILINKIKNRENYRPFGASVLQEHVSDYFDIPLDQDEYMLYTAKLKGVGLDAITHVDGTCRIQTVTDNNLIFKKLLQEFYKITGCPILLNTSLNLAGYPLAGYPEIALDLFYKTSLDAVFIGDQWMSKNDDLENDHIV
jgi:carbamoyltransferase